MKRISILVPCCNVEKYVRQCLDSIAVQTHSNLEVICIDDGSKDATGAIIDEFVAKDPRFKVIHKPNSGYGDSMNKGLDMATGDYIGIVESDDWIEPDMFETLYDVAEKNDLDVARCCYWEGPTGWEHICENSWIPKNNVLNPIEELGVFFQAASIWCSIYKAELLKGERKILFLPTPGASYQDTAFAFKVYSKAKRFLMIDRPYHHYRVNLGSSVASSGKVNCILDEYNEIVRWTVEDAEFCAAAKKFNLLPQIFWGGIDWNYNRIFMSLREPFLNNVQKLLQLLKSIDLINSDVQYKGKNELEQILVNPQKYHQARVYDVYDEECKDSQLIEYGGDLISVVVTIYNTSKYILPCLKSILHQGYKNIEVLCVDDNSNDDTVTLLKGVMEKDNRVGLLVTPNNAGLSACRNLGLQHCKGKYVMFVDGDDLLLPNAIADMHAKIVDGSDAVVASAKVRYDSGAEWLKNVYTEDKEYYTIPKSGVFNVLSDAKVFESIHVSAWAKLWRRDVINDNQICFPEGLLFEDNSFWWKYVSVAPNICLMQEPVYCYRRRAGSIMALSALKPPMRSIQHLYILRDYYQWAKLRNVSCSILLHRLYSPCFYFAWWHSPSSDHQAIWSVARNILIRQNASVSDIDLLKKIVAAKNIQEFEALINKRDEISQEKSPGGWTVDATAEVLFPANDYRARKVKYLLPWGIMRVWLKKKYGIIIDEPLFYYYGYRKCAKRIVKFLMPYGIVRKYAKPYNGL